MFYTLCLLDGDAPLAGHGLIDVQHLVLTLFVDAVGPAVPGLHADEALGILLPQHAVGEHAFIKGNFHRVAAAGIGQALAGLRALYLGSNDIRVVTDELSYMIYNLDIQDNPNISIDVSAVCSYIKSGWFNLMYSPGQDIRGCDFLNLD